MEALSSNGHQSANQNVRIRYQRLENMYVSIRRWGGHREGRLDHHITSIVRHWWGFNFRTFLRRPRGHKRNFCWVLRIHCCNTPFSSECYCSVGCQINAEPLELSSLQPSEPIPFESDGLYTLNRESLTCFVRTKPRGSVVITKPLASQRSLCARKASWLYFMTLYY